MIWLRRYPTFYHLAHHFDVPVNVVHGTIFRLVPIFHNYLVPKFIQWPDNAEWISMRGTFPEWPNVVGNVIDINHVTHNLKNFKRVYF